MIFKKFSVLFLVVLFVFCLLGCPPNGEEEEEEGPTGPITYTITFNANGGTVEKTSIVVGENQILSNFLQIPTRASHVFLFWGDANDIPLNLSMKITGNLTLKAIWAQEITVTFETDGGTPSINPIKLAQGAILGNKFPATPIKDEHTFAGWFDDSLEEGDEGFGEEFLSDTVIANSITLKAKWDVGAPPTFTVTFNTDGGSAAPSNVSVPQGSAMNTSYPANPTKSSFDFYGWHDSTGKLFTASSPITENVTLTAYWGQNIFWTSNGIEFRWDTPNAQNVGTIGRVIPKLKGMNNVLHVKPGTGGYEWNVIRNGTILQQHLNKTVTIKVTSYIWIEEPAGIAWQGNIKTSPTTYPFIAGHADINQRAGEWIYFEGSSTLTIPNATGGDPNVFYLSSGHSSWAANDPKEIYFADLNVVITEGTPNDDILVTIGSTKDLKPLVTIGTVTSWVSSHPDRVSVTNQGVVKALTYVVGGNSTFVTEPATGRVTITATAGSNTQLFDVVATTAAQEHISTLDPLKTKFNMFPSIGNIAVRSDSSGTAILNQSLNRHFNVLTAENDMKPSYFVTGREGNTFTYDFTNVDRFVDGAIASGHAVVGHTLLWHSQNGTHVDGIRGMGRDDALELLKHYVTTVVSRYAGRIYVWDILNEAFPDGISSGANWKTSIRSGVANTGNPWFDEIKEDFIYEAYLAARLADPAAILYYNDYNTDQVGKATVIRNMVQEVNNKYLALGSEFKPEGDPAGRLLIEGIGMQEHHNSGVGVNAVRATIDMFAAIGVEMAVSELDILAQSWSEYSSRNNPTNAQLMTQATQYKNFSALYREFAGTGPGKITRITIWGVTDNQSWRSTALPLLFDPMGRAKPAYYYFVDF